MKQVRGLLFMITVLIALVVTEAFADEVIVCGTRIKRPDITSSSSALADISIDDVLLECTGGQPGAQVSLNIQLDLNTPVVSGPTSFPFIFLTNPPSTKPGVVIGNTVFWNGLVVTQPPVGEALTINISNIRANATDLFNQSPNTNPAIYGTISVPQVTLTNPTLPLAIVVSDTPTCDESYFSSTLGFGWFLFAPNIADNGNLYTVNLFPNMQQDGSSWLNIGALWLGGNCPNSGNSLTAPNVTLPYFTLNLNNVNFNGTYYSVSLTSDLSQGAAFRIKNITVNGLQVPSQSVAWEAKCVQCAKTLYGGAGTSNLVICQLGIISPQLAACINNSQ